MFNAYRRATDSDLAAVQASAERFCDRHGIALHDGYYKPVPAIEMEVQSISYRDPAEASRLSRQWAACMCRALGVSYTRRIGIAYGHVGASI